MEPTRGTTAVEQLTARLDALERENTRPRDSVAALELRAATDKAVGPPASVPDQAHVQTSRRGLPRTATGVAAAAAGAGTLPGMRPSTALASGAEEQTSFRSTTTGPMVWVTNYGGGPGIHGHGDTDVEGFSTSTTGPAPACTATAPAPLGMVCMAQATAQ